MKSLFSRPSPVHGRPERENSCGLLHKRHEHDRAKTQASPPDEQEEKLQNTMRKQADSKRTRKQNQPGLGLGEREEGGGEERREGGEGRPVNPHHTRHTAQCRMHRRRSKSPSTSDQTIFFLLPVCSSFLLFRVPMNEERRLPTSCKRRWSSHTPAAPTYTLFRREKDHRENRTKGKKRTK